MREKWQCKKLLRRKSVHFFWTTSIVYFQDKDSNTIFEEDFHPVLVSKYSFSGDNKPLKPGYVKEMEQDKYYTLESPLSEWQEGKAIAKVVDIEFTK